MIFGISSLPLSLPEASVTELSKKFEQRLSKLWGCCQLRHYPESYKTCNYRNGKFNPAAQAGLKTCGGLSEEPPKLASA
jgi:hypothetical protein